ncbi:hypothetical protein [Photobacterium damselae]|uniref:hypothetical protein n=1 Tax=Photobacterium damselae TaxID=38293 RepID=UPI0030F3F88B
MNLKKVFRDIFVKGIGAFIGIKIITIALPEVFKYNEILGLFSILVIAFGSFLCMGKIYDGCHWLIKTSKIKNHN